MTEAIVLGVPLVAAIVYLVVELAELNIWWRKRKQPPKRPPGVGTTWPQPARADAEHEWRKALDKNKETDGN
jgi:hypothetical protein